MSKMNALLKTLNQKPIAYHRIYAQITGSVTAGLLLSQIIYWWYACNEQEFYKTDNDFCDELCMGVTEFRNAKEILKQKNIINTCLKQIPAKTHYSVNITGVFDLITSFMETGKLDYGKPINKIKGNLKTITETNKESNTETKEKTSYQDSKKLSNSEIMKTLPYNLCEYLFYKVLENYPNFRRKCHYSKNTDGEEYLDSIKINKKLLLWYEDMEKLIRIDERDPAEILEVIDWTQADKFWRQNIQSPFKLRQQYETLLIRMQEQQIPTTPSTIKINDSNPKLTAKLIRAYGLLINNKEYQPLNTEDRLKFIKSSEKVIQFCKKHSIIDKNRVNFLAKCLIKNVKEKGDVLCPGHMCSEYTWEVLMPQYVEELGIGR